MPAKVVFSTTQVFHTSRPATAPAFADGTFMARLDPYPDWLLHCFYPFLCKTLQSPPRQTPIIFCKRSPEWDCKKLAKKKLPALNVVIRPCSLLSHLQTRNISPAWHRSSDVRDRMLPFCAGWSFPERTRSSLRHRPIQDAQTS